MELNSLKNKLAEFARKMKQSFVKKSEVAEKQEINWTSIKALCFATLVLFIVIVLLLPSEQPVEFRQTAEPKKEENIGTDLSTNGEAPNRLPPRGAQAIWASPRVEAVGGGARNEINYNTSMVLGSGNGNAKTQVRAGERLPLRIMDKFIVSDSPVPILAELIVATDTDSGLRLPAGTRFYGEASFAKGQNRAQIRFTQISLLSGEIRAVQALALGKDGQPGMNGRVYSDGAKNTAGQVITTFVAGLAAGSVETDAFGQSRGGIQNGLMTAVAGTAKDRAQAYGEKLKAEREWIEVAAGAECDALLSQSLNLQRANEHE